mmetsp:Transcript_76427/g.170996  ORF Transcript_76427/g.170996 Transcript_76427/m.170996 type:complete len:243 (-) Transcript_76427:41-769(-)
MSEFSLQAVANTAWAFATLWCRHSPLLQALASAAKAHRQWRAQEVSNTAWAFAILEFRDEPCLEALSAPSLTMHSAGSQFTPQQVANMLWAFAVFTFKDAPLINSLAPAAGRIIVADFVGSARALASMPWALVRLQHRQVAGAMLRSGGPHSGQAVEALGPLLAECEQENAHADEQVLLARLVDESLQRAASGVLLTRSMEHGDAEAAVATELCRPAARERGGGHLAHQAWSAAGVRALTLP